mmetsp:Transcript_78246/g.221208  ORF Transcript_78246/g.221208 Transcript_78246/m.221208 type:complete len:191 (-) Transcript_78246:126-698(-)
MVAGLDNGWNKLHMECIQKEDRTRWNHPTSARSQSATFAHDREIGSACFRMNGVISPRTTAPRPFTASGVISDPPVSASIRFLEEKTGIADDSAEQRAGSSTCRADARTRELLYRGVSHDGAGRANYLKERKKEGIPERYGSPLTATQGYGVFPVDSSYYVTSRNVRKPIVQRSFFRTMGVITYRDLPGS